MASVNAVTHPVDGEGNLLSHLTLAQKEVLDEDLLLLDADDDIVSENRCAAAIRVLLTGASSITPVCPNNVNNHAGQMHGGKRRILGGRLVLCQGHLPQQLARLRCDGNGCQNSQCRALHTKGGATHLATHISIGAHAALPEAARGGIHGGGLWGFWLFTFVCTIPCPTRACRGLPECSP
jgi:hypothetical protein